MGDKSVKIVWGDVDTILELHNFNIDDDKVPEKAWELYEFDTEAELKAFLKGIFESMGWFNYWIVNKEGYAE